MVIVRNDVKETWFGNSFHLHYPLALFRKPWLLTEIIKKAFICEWYLVPSGSCMREMLNVVHIQ